MSIIEIKNLTYFYPNETRTVLENIDLTIEEGEFVLLVGGSGCGKSTLIKAMAGLVPEFYGGKIKGEIRLAGRSLATLTRKELVDKVGIVFQDPESQLVMTNVEQELVFGLENLGLDNSLMKRRVLEATGALSLGNYLKKNTPELSGGLKQKVALASVLAMQPEIILLDEPTSQLDPVSGEEILTILRRLNEENGITIVLVEQRLERCFHLADRILVMDKGKIICNTKNHSFFSRWSLENRSPFIPPLAKLFAGAGFEKVPLTVKEGRNLLSPFLEKTTNNLQEKKNTEEKVKKYNNTPLIEIEKLWFVYKNGDEALKNINLSIYPGDFTVIMGDNAAGKTTLLKVINGLLKPSQGKVEIAQQNTKKIAVEQLAQKVGYLSQNPNDYLFLNSVKEEVLFTLKAQGMVEEGKVDILLEKLNLSLYQDKNPRDLSSGERQRVALAAVLIANPEIILLDEPTRGLDYKLKKELGEILLALQRTGKTVIVVTHDVEFAAEYAQNIVLMSQGSIVAEGDKKAMLTKSIFYSPQISKLFYNYNNDIVTIEEGQQFLKSLDVGRKVGIYA
ncbi:MAG: ABC transporter ATP-binding protein [Peptococcales bacterium]|jgi:energy-coupling factor transporter ATP-binding protein EcfA2